MCALRIAQVREAYSAVRLLFSSLDLLRLYNVKPSELDDEDEESLSPLGFCLTLADKKGYQIARGRGAHDPHRAGLEILKDCVDGAVCLAFAPPPDDRALDAAAAAKPKGPVAVPVPVE